MEIHGKVIAVSKNDSHSFSKPTHDSIVLLERLGVEGDAHCGKNVKHRSRVKRDPHAPNLRQVHLVHKELFEELNAKNIHVSPGQIGENITTEGIDLLGLPEGTLLTLGNEAVVEITGLRNPCDQLNSIHPKLMNAVLEKDGHGAIKRKAGIMSIVIRGGEVFSGDLISVKYPENSRPLKPV